MPVHDHDLLAPVARHLIGRLLQQIKLHVHAVGDGSRLLPRLRDLSKVVRGKDHRVLLLRAMFHRITNVDQVRAQRQMRAMLFNDPEGQHAHALRLVNGRDKVRPGQFFPLR